MDETLSKGCLGAGCITFVGLFTLAFAFFASNLDDERSRWPTAPGVVESARITTAMVPTGQRIRLESGWQLEVRYRYERDGETRRGNRLGPEAPVLLSRHRETVDQRAAEYPIGRAVTVRVSPNDPSFSYIVPDGQETSLAWYFGTGLSALGLILGALYWFRARRSPLG